VATLRAYFEGERAGPKFERSVSRQGELVRSAMRGAAADVTNEIVARCRADIAGAGNFGERWINGFAASISEGGGNIRVELKHAVPYFKVFTKQTTIQGNPLLWIPLSYTGLKLQARDYPGQLFYTKRRRDGLDLLGDVDDGEMKYFGKESVTIPKKFRTYEIISEEMRKLKDLYKARRGS
jgi:hypothetical protein